MNDSTMYAVLMRDLEHQAADLSGAQGLLDEAVARCEAARAEAAKLAEPEIRRLAAVVARRKARLLETVAQNRGAFEHPKSVKFHGWRLGWAKQPGRIEFEDEESVIARVKGLFNGLVAKLVRVEESLDKKALRECTGDQLAALGVTITAAGDAPFLRQGTSDTEAAVAALLAAAATAEQAEQRKRASLN